MLCIFGKPVLGHLYFPKALILKIFKVCSKSAHILKIQYDVNTVKIVISSSFFI